MGSAGITCLKVELTSPSEGKQMLSAPRKPGDWNNELTTFIHFVSHLQPIRNIAECITDKKNGTFHEKRKKQFVMKLHNELCN